MGPAFLFAPRERAAARAPTYDAGMRPIGRCWLACVLLVYAAPAGLVAAQGDTAALDARAHSLETRLARTPSARSRCDLGFVYVRLSRAADGARELDEAITALSDATTAADRRLLAMCLYSRGRAAEALGDLQSARAAYDRSRRLRGDAATLARIEALERRPLASLGPDERAATAVCGCELADGSFDVVVLWQSPPAAPSRWSIVEWSGPDRGVDMGLAAVACTGDTCRADAFSEDASRGGNGDTAVTATEVHGGATPILEVRTRERAGERDQGVRIPTIDEDDVSYCALAGDGPHCVHLTLADRIQDYVVNAALVGASVTLHRVSGHLPGDLELPLDRPIPLLELMLRE